MKSIPVNGSTIGIAAAVLVAAIASTWAIARSTTHSDVAAWRGKITACEQRAAIRLAESALAREAAVAATKRETARVQELETTNEQLRQANKEKEQEIAVAEANRPRGSARRHGLKAAAAPQQTFELSSGEQRAIIPGVLDVAVDKLDPASAEVRYGGHPRHLKVGESVAINYLGRPCVLALTEIKGGGDGQKGAFTFSVTTPERLAAEAAIPAEGP